MSMGLMEKFVPKPGDGECVFYYQETGRTDGDNRIVLGYSPNGPWAKIKDYTAPCRLDLIAWEPGTEGTLRARLDRFQASKVSGTAVWLNPTEEVAKYIRSLGSNVIPPRPKSKRMSLPDAKKKLIHGLRNFRPSLVRAVAMTILEWYASGKHPGTEDIRDLGTPQNIEAVEAVKAKWIKGTGNKDFPFTDMTVTKCWRKVRERDWSDRSETVKPACLLKVEWLLSKFAKSDGDTWG